MSRLLAVLGAASIVGCVTGTPVLSPDAAVEDGPVGACARTPRRDLTFERHVLETDFYGEAIGAFDVDEDGALDLVTLPYWWSGPDFAARHEVTTPFPPLDPATEFGSTYGVYPWDVDGDGCTDAVVPSRESDPQMFWWRNPPRAGGGCGDPDVHWEPSAVLGPDDDGTIEGPIVAELAAGRPALVMGRGTVTGGEARGATLGWWEPAADPRAPWQFHAISGPASRSAQAWTHGLGVGDLNLDGRADVLTPFAWFEQPEDPTTSPWPEHTFPDGFRAGIDEFRVCSSMHAYDVDDDGAPDVICARPHDYGLWWWHQIAGSDGPTFEALLADGTTLPAMHAVVLADLDGEGVPEVVTGERYLAHAAPAPPPPRLVYYTICRDEVGPHFAPHPIDGDSGVGVQFAVADLDGDGRLDVAVASKRGVFYFLRR